MTQQRSGLGFLKPTNGAILPCRGSRRALRVTETGEYDEETKQYRTAAFIPLEDGTRDENVRTITKLAKPNEIEYSLYSNETSELLNLVVTMRPKP